MKFIRVVLLVLTAGISLNVFSQGVEESVIRQISPLTPNAASLGKYGDVPVSLYTGIPNISIPLYEIKVGAFTLPIALSYHASGVQVDDVPSWVGTGWTLNAGGALNRRMRGVEDYKMINSKGVFADEIEIIEDPSAPILEKRDAAQAFVDGAYDTESDIFSISTGTLSHKFFLDVDGNSHGMPARKLQVIPEGSESRNQGNHIYYARWRIRDETGVEYIFGRTLDDTKDEFEITKSEATCGAASGDQEYINTWYLNQIKLPDGESIYFTYEYFTFCRANMPATSFSLSSNSTSTASISTNYLRALRIKEITFPTGKIAFVPGDLRRDINGDNVLDQIKIFSKRFGNYFEEKSFHFATNNPSGNTTSGDESFRLALLSITEFDKDGTPLSPYKFEYKHQPLETYNLGLPPRLSFAQDLWGYYNGKTMNEFLFPNFIYLDEFYGAVVHGADRSVSPENAQTGILTKITYPTKGTTQFFYESNIAKGITREDAALTWGNWETTPKPFQNPIWDLVSLRAEETTIQHVNIFVLNEQGNDFKYDTFQIFDEGLTDVEVSSHIMYGENNTPCTATTPPGSEASFWECLDIILEKKGSDGQFYAENSTVYFNRSYGLRKGEYRIKLAWKDISPNDNSLDQAGAYAYLDLNWMGPTSPTNFLITKETEFVVGGLRIAKIVDSDDASGKEIVRSFDYDYDETDYDENLVRLPGSSGTIQNTPLHYTNANFLNFFSNSFALQTSGGYVGYKKVTVSYGADKKGGRQISYFTSAADYPDGNLAVSKQWSEGYEPVEVDWRRGLNVRVVDLKYENNAYTPIRESEKHFTFLSQPLDPNNYHKIDIRVPSLSEGGGVRHSTYKTVSESFYMDQLVERTKDAQGTVVTTTNFEQNPLNLAVSKTTTNNSRDDQVQVVTKYPVDYGNVENINTLRARNIISVPIKTETTKNNKLVNGVVVKYTDLGQAKEVYKYENSNLVDAPAHSDNTIVPTNYVLKSQFSYSATGNKLKQSKQSNNYPTAYIWGYDHSFPVVKIENIEASQILPSLITNIEAHVFTGGIRISDLQSDVEFLNAQVNTLRNNKNYSVTTYTYNTAFGLTSQTDPNGITTYFENDGYGRLQRIKDDEENVIKAIEYHYKGQ